MSKTTRFVGLDVHAETIAVATAAPGSGPEELLGTVPNTPDSIARLIHKLGGGEGLRVCYEAGPCGYVIYRQLVALGAHCDVVAPTLIPVRAGDRVKTDKRDARKLVRLYRSGELTPAWVPDEGHEALRDIVRAREAAKKDQTRARHRLTKMLLRLGRRAPKGVRNWTQKHDAWLRTLHFEIAAQQAAFDDYFAETTHQAERVARLEGAIEEALAVQPEKTQRVVQALQVLRGVAVIGAATLVAEVGDFSRFAHAGEIMSYSGLVPSEHSSGGSKNRGAITKTGNSHLRRILVEAAWNNTKKPSRGAALRKRSVGVPAPLVEIGKKAQSRLHARWVHLTGRGIPKPKVATAVARELLGFAWDIARQAERDNSAAIPAPPPEPQKSKIRKYVIRPAPRTKKAA